MDLLWSRSDKFLDKNLKFEKIIVHGHTPENEIVNDATPDLIISKQPTLQERKQNMRNKFE